MIIIANPIYDAVFKFLMEDQKVAKIKEKRRDAH